ncbi:hypothetical protein LCGC14_2127670 [marine sediment metagenome]|uniref:Uncharacterized protein n=1 Tax=marine sediment metagenome TaxID=412755 RepID=A0A0F9GYI4_9ZZZZ
MNDKELLSKEQEDGIRDANASLKKVFPKENMQISLNLAKTHNNVNYNIKKSGILNPKKPKT